MVQHEAVDKTAFTACSAIADGTHGLMQVRKSSVAGLQLSPDSHNHCDLRWGVTISIR